MCLGRCIFLFTNPDKVRPSYYMIHGYLIGIGNPKRFTWLKTLLDMPASLSFS